MELSEQMAYYRSELEDTQEEMRNRMARIKQLTERFTELAETPWETQIPDPAERNAVSDYLRTCLSKNYIYIDTLKHRVYDLETRLSGFEEELKRREVESSEGDV